MVVFNNEVCVDELEENEKFSCINNLCIKNLIIVFDIGDIFDFFVGFFVKKENNVY